MIVTDSIAIGTPKATPSLALLGEEEEGSEEMTGWDGGVGIDGVDVAEEPTGADGSAELDAARISAEVVGLAENVFISTCWVHVSNVSENDT